MAYLVEGLAELRRHLDHLHAVRPRVTGRQALERDLSLHNDVLFSLLTVCQLVIAIAGELSSRRGDHFDDYTQAITNLGRDVRFPAELVEQLEPLPGFRNVLVHEYVALDLDRVVVALDRLEGRPAPSRALSTATAGRSRPCSSRRLLPTTTSTSDPRQAHRVQLCAPDCTPTPIRRSSGAEREMKPASRAARSAA